MAGFGERLRELIDNSETQHKEIARLLNVVPSTISKWLKDERFPNDEKVLIFLADHFDVTTDYLLGRTSIERRFFVLNRRRLLELMKEKNMTVYKLWKSSGVAQSTISNIFNKEDKNFTANTLHRLAAALEVSVSELVEVNSERRDKKATAGEDNDGFDAEIREFARDLKKLSPGNRKLIGDLVKALME